MRNPFSLNLKFAFKNPIYSESSIHFTGKLEARVVQWNGCKKEGMSKRESSPAKSKVFSLHFSREKEDEHIAAITSQGAGVLVAVNQTSTERGVINRLAPCQPPWSGSPYCDLAPRRQVRRHNTRQTLLIKATITRDLCTSAPFTHVLHWQFPQWRISIGDSKYVCFTRKYSRALSDLI